MTGSVVVVIVIMIAVAALGVLTRDGPPLRISTVVAVVGRHHTSHHGGGLRSRGHRLGPRAVRGSAAT